MTPEQFLDAYGRRTGRWLANRLGLSGKGSEQLARLLSDYAWNLRAAKVRQDVALMKGRTLSNCCYASYCAQAKVQIQVHPLYAQCSRRLAFW